MDVRIVSATFLKPSLVIDAPKKVPLTIFDRVGEDYYVPFALVFAPPNIPSNKTLKNALAETLSEFPYLASKLSTDEFNHPCFLIDHDAGVVVTEAEITGNLDDYMPLEPCREVAGLFPNWEGLEHVMTIKLNRFDCGGLVIGVAAHHKVGDGQSMSHFYISWGQRARGLKIKPTPNHDQSLLLHRNPPKVEFPHEILEFEDPNHPTEFIDQSLITSVKVHYSSNFISKLKEKASEQGTKHSTFRCLTAHLWQKLCEVQGLDDSRQTKVVVPVNGRPKLLLPNEFFGNVVLCAYPTATAKELRQGGISFAAKVIEEAIGGIGKDYFQSFIDFGAVRLDHEGDADDLVYNSYEDGNSLMPNMEVNSWLGFDFNKMDIGGGQLVALLPYVVPIEGVVLLIPSPTISKEQTHVGINVHISLRQQYAQVFKTIAHTIN